MNLSAQRRLYEWAQMVDDWQRSGMTQGGWCRVHGMAKSTFKYRKDRVESQAAELMQKKASGDIVPVPQEVFVPVETENEKAADHMMQIDLEHANIKVSDGIKSELLKAALEVLVHA